MAQIIPIRKRRDLLKSRESRCIAVPAATNAPACRTNAISTRYTSA